MVASVFGAIPEKLHIYWSDQTFNRTLHIPDGYLTSYQVSTAGLSNPVFKVERGNSANVTADGFIEPDATCWYCVQSGSFVIRTTQPITNYDWLEWEFHQGVTNISVKTDTETYYIAVNVSDYSECYINDKINNVLNQIITPEMSQYEKLESITKWVAHNTDYNVTYKTYKALLIYDAGNYYASNTMIIEMAKRVGINATTRRGIDDMGSGGTNALAIIDGRFFIADAGYTGKKPRNYTVAEEYEGFAMFGNRLVQYDGWNTSVRVPSKVWDRDVLILGKEADSEIFLAGNMEELHLPSSVKSIMNGVLYKNAHLKKVTVDPDSEYYEGVDGILYSKNRTTLILAPRMIESLTIDQDTQQIGYACCTYLNIPKLVIPSSVKSIGKGAFWTSNISEIIFEDGIESLGESAFKSVIGGATVVLPETVTRLSDGVFYGSYLEKVVLSKNIQTLPRGTFQESYVKNAVLPHGIKVIGGRTFYHNRNLKNVTVPKSVEKIDTEAFSSVYDLTDIYYEGTEQQWNKINHVTAIPDKITIHFLGIPTSSESSSEPHEPSSEPHEPSSEPHNPSIQSSSPKSSSNANLVCNASPVQNKEQTEQMIKQYIHSLFDCYTVVTY